MDSLRDEPITESAAKEDIAASLLASLAAAGFTIAEVNFAKPWGGYIRLDDANIGQFLKAFFAGVQLPQWAESLSMSPKLLVVEPGRLLSWQVHGRRAELWRVIRGPVGVYRSTTDEQPAAAEVFTAEDIIDLPLSIRHRLAGTNTWGIVSEIWVHTDPAYPSDEDDIIRLADDFGRS